MRDLPPRARAYVASVVAVAASALLLSALNFDGSWQTVATLALLHFIANTRATVAATGVSVSVAFIVGLASVAITGPLGAMIVGASAVGIIVAKGPSANTKRLFNGAQTALSLGAAGCAWQLLGAPVGHLDQSDFPRVLIASAIAGLVFFLVNNAFVAFVVAATQGISPRRVWAGSISWLAVGYLGYSMLGLVLAQLFYELPGILAGAFFLVPLLIARNAFANYSELREAYDSTVRALCQAVETKDYYTRGHSERVGRITELIAREWGMREDRVQVIRYAGMMHDVGKLGVPTRVLQKQGKLNSDEFEAIKLHPMRGYEMLCEIDFLGEALDGVVHHHERMDGRGYPKGLTGDEIPEFARIIMVADAFDSMTSTRSYRMAKSVDAAIEELRRCEGPQFDKEVVDCLVRALSRTAWEPTPEDFHGEQVTRDGQPMLAAVTEDRSVVEG